MNFPVLRSGHDPAESTSKKVPAAKINHFDDNKPVLKFLDVPSFRDQSDRNTKNGQVISHEAKSWVLLMV